MEFAPRLADDVVGGDGRVEPDERAEDEAEQLPQQRNDVEQAEDDRHGEQHHEGSEPRGDVLARGEHGSERADVEGGP